MIQSKEQLKKEAVMLQEISSQFNEKEKLLWSGRPNFVPKRSFSNLFFRTVHIVEWLFYIAVFVFMTWFIFFFDVGEDPFGDWIYFAAALLLMAMIEYLPNKLSQRELANSLYVVTDKRLFFRAWRLFKGVKINSIGLHEIHDVKYEVFKNDEGRGKLHFIMKHPLPFDLKELPYAESFHPGFESVSDVMSLYEMINDARSKAKFSDGRLPH